MPGSRSANIDHIAVGPGRVTAIDTKNYRGEVCVHRIGGLFSERREVLKIADRDKTKLVAGVERQIAAVRAVLADHGQPIEIRGALCLPISTGSRCCGTSTSAASWSTLRAPRQELASRPGSLTPAQVSTLHEYLSTTLGIG